MWGPVEGSGMVLDLEAFDAQNELVSCAVASGQEPDDSQRAAPCCKHGVA
jgi:hypothetical protein